MTADPLLDGDLATRAYAALDDLSRALVSLDPARIPGLSLATGAAGHALAHAYLSRLFPDRAHGAAVQALAGRIVAESGAGPISPWLVSGLAGIGWLLEHLTKGDPDPSDPNERIDRALLARLGADPPPPYEFMHGVAGLVAYGVERLPSASARSLLEAVAARLLASATTGEDGASWLSSSAPPPGAPTAAREDFGFAHGGPGAIAALAALVRHDVAADALRPLLASACRRLLGLRLPRDGDAWFPSSSAAPREASRTAYCYGDPGVAWALFAAGRALADGALTDEARAVAVHAARRSVDRTGVRDAGFCHGAAGLAHLFHRMHALSGEAELGEASRAWIARALAMRVPGAPLAGFRSWLATPTGAFEWADDASLLTGAAGIALVLASALDPETSGWDAPLLLGSGAAGLG
jgi:lantibiotic biosynthesis protein